MASPWFSFFPCFIAMISGRCNAAGGDRFEMKNSSEEKWPKSCFLLHFFQWRCREHRKRVLHGSPWNPRGFQWFPDKPIHWRIESGWCTASLPFWKRMHDPTHVVWGWFSWIGIQSEGPIRNDHLPKWSFMIHLAHQRWLGPPYGRLFPAAGSPRHIDHTCFQP